jgi:CubicO group peptidase (beta-lactamase class C family)
MTRRRWLSIVVGLLVVGASAAVALVVAPLAVIGTAYKAKMLCSEVFVAHRRPADVVSELERDDLAIVRVVRTRVDSIGRTTTARIPGLIERRAVYRPAVGCALDLPSDRRPPPVAPPGTMAHRSELEVDTTLPAAVRDALAAAIDSAFAEPDPELPRRTRAVVVLYRGRVVGERYADGFTAETPMIGWSMTKSVLSALVGVAVDRRLLTLESAPPLPGWKEPGDARRAISVADLLQMSSGLRFNESAASPSSDVLTMLFRSGDMAAFAANRELDERPGHRWQYTNGTTLLLSGALREVLGDSAYLRFPREALFDPIGMTSAVLEADASGTFVGSSYLYATARDWARFGQLYLQRGVWEGRAVLPRSWIDYTRTPAPADSTRGYGAHFWLRTPAEYRGPPVSVPADAYHAVGHEGQFVTIVPSRDVVIVRLGRTRDPRALAHDAFVASILTALRPAALAPRHP